MSCEQAGCPATCAAIIKAVYELDAKEQEFVSTWREDASLAIVKGHVATARCMFKNAVKLYTLDVKLWDDFITFEQRAGSKETFKEVLSRASQV